MQRWSTALSLLLVLALSLGCGSRPVLKTPKNLKEWFQQKEANFDSADGTIDMDSVREAGPNIVEYQTVKNGARKTWRQKYRPAGSGNYERVGDPEDISAKAKAETGA
jgi:hypothetical protein